MKSVTVWMCVHIFLLLLVCPPDESASSWETPSALSVSLASGSPGSLGTGSGPGAQPEWVDCIQASDMCNQNPYCSSRYRVMRQCLVGKEKEAMLDNNRECQAALEVLLVSPLYDCRCKRGMKKELQCLQNYWTIHMGLTEDGDMDDSSPYEPVAPSRQHDAFRLASISSGTSDRRCEHAVGAADPSPSFRRATESETPVAPRSLTGVAKHPVAEDRRLKWNNHRRNDAPPALLRLATENRRQQVPEQYETGRSLSPSVTKSVAARCCGEQVKHSGRTISCQDLYTLRYHVLRLAVNRLHIQPVGGDTLRSLV
ncbi:uncharacterized protein [Notothenia coriiceps]|uniref:GDNF/GAS1 domain-containing protein n=1 Tax=Notothenia coriiceps TaxID=8208 RepID=A0A6I9MMX3_9TELE|nr:PREDICTED: GDNF family receptor alpha-2 [Notothenia coriiceps]